MSLTAKTNYEMLGRSDGTAVVTDADGTLQQYLRGLVKLVITAGGSAVSTVLGATTGAAVITDANGTIQQYARGLVTLILAMSGKLPASLGVKAASASLSVTQSTEDAAVMAKLEARIAQPLMTAAPASISIGTSTARTTGLIVGTVYMVYASTPCFIKVGNDTVEAATTDVYIEPGMVFCWTPTADNTDDGVACIGAVAGGKVYVQACQA